MESLNRILLKWWFLFCTQLALSTVAYHFGFFNHLYREDPTRIGFLILGILILTTLWIGKKVHSLKKHWQGAEDAIKCLSPGWFVAESCFVLGLIGSVTGFILMLGVAFINLDVTIVASVQEALKNMSIGMSTALYTTLVGLVSSLAIKVQLVTIERQLEGC